MRHQKLIRIILGSLVLQFVLGMLANLYATIPADKPYEVFHQVGFINLHALNGTLLLVLSTVLTVKARRLPYFRPAAAGLFHIVLAFTFGELFVFTQNDIFSLLMALAFMGALIIYARLVFSAGTHK